MSIETLPILGRTLASVVGIPEDNVLFTLDDGSAYRMQHHQDCCESVVIEQVDGDISDIIGSPLLIAETSFKKQNTEDGTQGWTFYRFATVKGYVTIRWSGNSNGYYSVGVSFEQDRGSFEEEDDYYVA